MSIIHTLNVSEVLKFGKVSLTDEDSRSGNYVYVIFWNTKAATEPESDWLEKCGRYFMTTAVAYDSEHNVKTCGKGLSASVALGREIAQIEWEKYLQKVFVPGLVKI